MKIVILYGTETGNAEMLALDVSRHLEKTHTVVTRNMDKVDVSIFELADLSILVCSTYGEGELPATAKPFHEKLVASKPALNGVRYAIFGMGDSQYPDTFGYGAAIFDDLLRSLGAVCVGERGMHDASGVAAAEDVAIEWLAQAMNAAEAT